MSDPSGGQINSDASGASQDITRRDPAIAYVDGIDASGGNIRTTQLFTGENFYPRKQSGEQQYSRPPSTPQSLHYAASINLDEAINAARDMENAATDNDLIQLSISGFQLRDALQKLWGLRKLRESDWQDLLVMLQASITNEHFERFSVEQCKAVRIILETHLLSIPVDISDLESTLRILRKAKLDPWKSASSEDEAENE
jgi:hypothetical protein